MNYNDTRQEVIAFLIHCQWTQDCWVMHSSFFNKNPAIVNLNKHCPVLDRFLKSYSHISLAYTVLQIGKLHDTENSSLTIKSIWKKSMNYCSRIKQDLNFTDSEMAKKKVHFEKIKNELDYFHECHIRKPRNFIIAHSDAKTYLNDASFELLPDKDMEDFYLKKLKKLSDTLLEFWSIEETEIKPLDQDAKNDTEAVVQRLISCVLSST